MNLASRMTAGTAFCVLLLGLSSAGADDWPQWRGPNRDNKVTGFTAPSTWPKELTQKWKVTIGVGDASPVLVGDKIYVFTRQGGDETTLCLKAADGSEIWHDKYAAPAVTGAPSQHPGTRSTPAVAEGKVCTLGAAGTLSCLDAEKGTVAWRKETEHPKFWDASSPIIVDGKCIAEVGTDGAGGIAAYDLTSGEEKWKWPGAGPAYSSPVLLTVDGVKQIVALTEKSVVGVGAADGKLLWEIPFKAGGMGSYNSITPLVDGSTVYYAREGTGTTAVKVEKKGDGFTASQVWSKSNSAGKYNTPVLKDGLIYGLAGGGRGATTLFCMKADTGDMAWTDSTKRGECGAILDAGDVLLALSSDSQLIVFKPSDKGYMEVAKYKVADSPTWADPIIAGNRVFVKDKDSLTLWTLE
ncbi:MAG TPA: PQQ-binding-like beta-propeller repeat protein [Gemmataceae bacterium]|nr:PQQ-binding-like beta-propeller repeat protein [Gemmataceae bacterium]